MPDRPQVIAPPLAGVCAHAEAASPGPSVEESVRRLVRLHWVERRTFEILVARIPSTPEWEVKGALALHQWLAVIRADALRERIAEMRSPPPRMDTAPDDALEAALAEAAAADGTLELLQGIHGVVLPALEEAYRRYLEDANPLVDHPTRRLIRAQLADLGDTIAWGRATLDSGGPGAFAEHVAAYLAAAGGVDGRGPRPAGPLPSGRAATADPLDYRPRRDARFQGVHNFNFPPHVLYDAANIDAEERNLALLCKRLLEMDVPEMMASFISERRDRPWAFYVDYARQLWDEARHSMMGEVALEARGVRWRDIPLNVGFSLRLNLHADPRERQLMLWAIEQSLMPGETGKRAEYETALEAGDALSAHFHDFDWADEVLHARIGRRWLLGPEGEGLTFAQAMAAGRAVHDKTWPALEDYRKLEVQTEWWSAFVREVLGRDSGATPRQLVEDPKVITE